MKPILALCFLVCISPSSAIPDPLYQSFLCCLSALIPPTTNVSELLFTPYAPSYYTLLQSSIQNLRFTSDTTPKPLLIVKPADETQVQAAILCSRNHSLSIRVRSGGHDYEGLSYRSLYPTRFLLLDLSALRAVSVDVHNGTAWVQAGATVGELMYGIAEKSEAHGFPEGSCPTIGVGGYISGGGIGNIIRKYGLAADNVVDARIVVASGMVLERGSMGEDLFWAIRGGGGSSFGVVVSWKLRLLPVPATVTVFSVNRTREQGAIELVTKWQHVAHKLDENLFINLDIRTGGGRSSKGVVEPEAVFKSLYLGGRSELLQLMGESFPELGVNESDCNEVSWVRSYLYMAGYQPGGQLEVLTDRSMQPKVYNKGKSDYVKKPINLTTWEMIWERLSEDGAGSMMMIPHGGIMDEIPRSATPYPHRRGSLYIIQYLAAWRDGGEYATEKQLDWMRRMYDEMGDYVSSNPRGAYVNHRDLDLGWNEKGESTNYDEAKVWGRKYFKGNFKRLAMVKELVDPCNMFVFEQSIPPFGAKARP